MRKSVLSTLVVALLLGTLGFAPAQTVLAKDVKPLAIVSLAGGDNLMADVKLLAQLGGQPEADMAVKAMLALVTEGKGLAGLDMARPWGVIIGTDGEDIGGCAFVPVTDLDKMMQLGKRFAKDKLKKHDDGVYEIESRKKTVYIKEQHKGWAFVVDNPEIFNYVPADPIKALDGLNSKYDVAVRLYPANVPAKHREKIAAKMKEHAARDLKRRDHESDAEYTIRKTVMQALQKRFFTCLGDLEQITLGWSLDEDIEQGVLDVNVTVKQGSRTAKAGAWITDAKTAFGGFELPGAAVTYHNVSQWPPLKASELDTIAEAMRTAGYEKIESKDKADEEVKVAKELLDGLLDVLRKTAATGRDDEAMALRLDADALTAIGGHYVADGPELEALVKQLAAEIRKRHPDCVDKVLTLDADCYHGVNFHLVSLPIEKCPVKEKAKQAVGETFDIVLGFGPEAVYVSAGRDAMKSLKRAIAESELAAQWPVPPLELTVDLGQVAAFAAQCPKEKHRAKAEKAVEILAEAHGLDRVRVVAFPADHGLTFRLQLEEGALRLMGAAKKLK